jgi:hypothetical protein
MKKQEPIKESCFFLLLELKISNRFREVIHFHLLQQTQQFAEREDPIFE